ncbi:hypothetical protein [Streptomyces marianii]|nr:hypothetical protein [Streptomyces marianii]
MLYQWTGRKSSRRAAEAFLPQQIANGVRADLVPGPGQFSGE